MSTFIEEPTATVAEIAKRAGMTAAEVETEAGALGLFVGLDWSHQPALAARDAFVLVDGSGRRNLEHETAFRNYTAAAEQWQTEREAVRRDAFKEAWEANVRHGWGNSASTSKAHEAAREAVSTWEGTNPEPVWTESKSGLRSLLSRVKAGVR